LLFFAVFRTGAFSFSAGAFFAAAAARASSRHCRLLGGPSPPAAQKAAACAAECSSVDDDDDDDDDIDDEDDDNDSDFRISRAAFSCARNLDNGTGSARESARPGTAGPRMASPLRLPALPEYEPWPGTNTLPLPPLELELPPLLRGVRSRFRSAINDLG
jgi:hypothetical protein